MCFARMILLDDPHSQLVLGYLAGKGGYVNLGSLRIRSVVAISGSIIEHWRDLQDKKARSRIPALPGLAWRNSGSPWEAANGRKIKVVFSTLNQDCKKRYEEKR